MKEPYKTEQQTPPPDAPEQKREEVYYDVPPEATEAFSYTLLGCAAAFAIDTLTFKYGKSILQDSPEAFGLIGTVAIGANYAAGHFWEKYHQIADELKRKALG